MHTAIAAGSDTLSIFENKDFLITEVLGSKEIKKDGSRVEIDMADKTVVLEVVQ